MKVQHLVLFGLFFVFTQTARASDLDWLVGCWETPDKSAMEAWVKDNDGSLTGFSATVKDGRVVFYEVLRIDWLADGSASYTAHPAGQASATFTAATIAGTDVTFSNPAHDFPQVISYKREGTVLYATISALDGTNPVTFNKRACED